MYHHYTKPEAAASIVQCQELWGKTAGPFGIGGLAARAFLGSHNPNKVGTTIKAVEFTSTVTPPRTAPWHGGTAVLWPDGTPGTSTITLPSGDEVVRVPISITGVFP